MSFTYDHSAKMKTAPFFQRPQARQLERGQYHTYKLHTTPADATSPIYKFSGPPSYAVAKTLLKGDALTVFEQAEINH
eukprot:6044064-Ditylum_brightwellii.AAC.1